MVKKFCCFFLLFFFITSMNGCSLQSDTHNFGVRIFLLADQETAFVIDQSKPNESGKLFCLNIQSKKLTPLLFKWEGKFFDNDPFAQFELSSDLILSFRPKNEKYYGIWKFDLVSNQANCLTKGIEKNCYLQTDDRENNLLFFKQTNDWKPQDLYVMSRNGNDMKLVDADFEVYPDEYGKINEKTYFFVGTSEKNGGKMLLFDIPTKKTSLFSGSSYSSVGVYQNKLIAVIHSNSYDDNFISVEQGGVITPIQDIQTNEISFYLIDSIRKNLLFANELENQNFQVKIFNLETRKNEILSASTNNEYPTTITLNEKNNTIGFFTESVTPSGNKMLFNNIDINTKKNDSMELNKKTLYWISSDCKYLFGFRVDEDFKKNAIIDTTTKKLVLLTDKIRIDFLSIAYIESNEKFLFSGYNDAKENILCTVDKWGKVEIITKF